MSHVVMPYTRAFLELRMGRVNALADVLTKSPGLLNQKFQTSVHVQESFLDVAVRSDQTNAVFWLLSKGAQETPDTSPHLMCVTAMNGNVLLCEEFNKRGWNPWTPTDQPTPLDSPVVQSVLSSNMALLEMWASRKVNFKQTDPATGNNLLHMLAQSLSHQHTQLDKSIQVAKWLIKKGVSGVQANAEGFVPSDLCAHEKSRQQLVSAWNEFAAAKTKKTISKSIAISSALPAAPRRKKM